MNFQQNDMAYWWPKLSKLSVHLPRTELVITTAELSDLLDGQMPDGHEEFIDRLHKAAIAVGGFPCFLRTGHTSGKHDWSDTCEVRGAYELAGHVAMLVEYSALAHIVGLPTQTWAVREFLALAYTFRAFKGMPVATEFRSFFRDGKHLCTHPYWPIDSIERPTTPGWRQKLAEQNKLSANDDQAIRQIVKSVAAEFDGGWSVDTALGQDDFWYVIDMARMEDSFHWPGCPFGEAK